MLARVFSCAVIGLEGVIVEVEVDTTIGCPAPTLSVCLIKPCRRVVRGAIGGKERCGFVIRAEAYRG